MNKYPHIDMVAITSPGFEGWYNMCLELPDRECGGKAIQGPIDPVTSAEIIEALDMQSLIDENALLKEKLIRAVSLARVGDECFRFGSNARKLREELSDLEEFVEGGLGNESIRVQS